jgi:hypothetical protein
LATGADGRTGGHYPEDSRLHSVVAIERPLAVECSWQTAADIPISLIHPNTCVAMFGQPGASQRYSVSASSRPSGAKRSVLIVTRGIDPPASDAFKWRSNWLLAFLRASAHFGSLGLAGWSISLTELCEVPHNSPSQESGFYEAYVGFARTLSVWLIAYGIGGPAIFLTNEAAGTLFSSGWKKHDEQDRRAQSATPAQHPFERQEDDSVGQRGCCDLDALRISTR